MEMDPLDDTLPHSYIQEGYREGVEGGERRAREEGFFLGFEDGERLGRLLGSVAGLMLRLLRNHSESLSEVQVRKIRRILTELSLVSLQNVQDPSKEQKLLRIHATYRELLASCDGRSSLAMLLPPLTEFAPSGNDAVPYDQEF